MKVINISNANTSLSDRENTPVRNIIEYINQIQRVIGYLPGNYIFRGQSDVTYHLSSSAARRIRKTIFRDNKLEKTDISEYLFIEYHEKFLNDIKLKGLDKIEGRGLSDIEILADLQHNGAATCLIDFTYNALVALWFAFNGNSENDCVVYLIDINNRLKYQKVNYDDVSQKIRFFLNQTPQRIPGPSEEDEVVDQDEEGNDIICNQYDYWTQPKIWYWEAPKINRRIPIQQSIFVYGKPDLEHDHKVVISSLARKSILTDLNKCFNISYNTLFPDFSGYAGLQCVDNEFNLWGEYSYLHASAICVDKGKSNDIIEQISMKSLSLDSIRYYSDSLIPVFRKIGKLDFLIQETEQYLKHYPNECSLYFALYDMYKIIDDKEKCYSIIEQYKAVVKNHFEYDECERRLFDLSE